MRNIHLLGVMLLGLFFMGGAWGDNSTTSVPLTIVPVGAHNYKVGITVAVAGGPPTQVTFDTGGVGLHIFASQVGNQNIKYTSQRLESVFGSAKNGFTLEGVIAYAPVTIGSVTTQPIPIMVIQNVICHDGSHACGFNLKNGAPPMFGQFYGELGAGMMPEAGDSASGIHLYSPLRDLPGNYGSGFIIKNLHPGGIGTLILGLTAENSTGFNKVALKKYGNRPGTAQTLYNDKSLMVNYTIGEMTQTWRTAFDTGGNANVNLYTGPIPGIPLNKAQRVKRGVNFEASLPGAFVWQFFTGQQEGENAVQVHPLLGNRPPYVNSGLLFFFNYNVLYDFNNGELGFQQQ